MSGSLWFLTIFFFLKGKRNLTGKTGDRHILMVLKMFWWTVNHWNSLLRVRFFMHILHICNKFSDVPLNSSKNKDKPLSVLKYLFLSVKLTSFADFFRKSKSSFLLFLSTQCPSSVGNTNSIPTSIRICHIRWLIELYWLIRGSNRGSKVRAFFIRKPSIRKYL